MNQPLTAAVRFLSGEREPVRVATTGNITLQGLRVIDDVELNVGDRVLVKDQTDKKQNGIYLSSEGRWYRAPDASYARSINEGVTVQVQEGTLNNGRTYRFATANPNVGVDEIVIQFFLSSNFLQDALDEFGVIATSVVAVNDGLGSDNAIEATTSITVDDAGMIILPITETNAGSPVTVSFNGGAPLTIKTNSGNDVAPGGLVPGMLVMGRVSGSTFRLASDQASAAVVAQAEAVLAEFKTLYLGAYSNDAAATTAAGGTPNEGAEYWNSTTGTRRVWHSGAWVAQTVSISDGDVTDVKVAEPGTPAEGVNATKIKIDLTTVFTGAVVRLISDKFKDMVSARDFGAYGVGNDDTVELQEFVTECMKTGLKLLVPTGEYGISGSGIRISSVDGSPIDNSGGANPIAKRSKFVGEGPGSTIFRHSGTGAAITIITANSRQTHGNFAVIKDTTTKNGIGMSILETATMGFENILIKGFDIGLYTRDDFSLAFSMCEFEESRIGWQADYTTISKPNDFTFNSCHWRKNTQVGAYVKNPVTLNLRGGTFEGNGSGAAENCGIRIFGSPRDGSLGLNADGVYFEGNWGDADIIINNDSFGAGMHRVEGCVFNRIDPAKYVKNSVRIFRNNAAYMAVKFDTNAFNNFNGYVADAARKFVQCYSTASAPVNSNDPNGPTVSYDFNLFGNATETPT